MVGMLIKINFTFKKFNFNNHEHDKFQAQFSMKSFITSSLGHAQTSLLSYKD